MRNARFCVAALTVLGALAVPAADAAHRTDLTGPNVIRYVAAGEFVAGTTEIVVGRATPTGCAFERESVLRPGESASLVEIAYDPDTCRSLVAVSSGAAAADDPTAPGTAGTSSQGTTLSAGTDGASATEGTDAVAAAFGRFRAYQWSWFDEPARWVQGCDVEESCGPLPPVNTVKNTIEWTPDHSCSIAPGTTGQAESALTWFTTTGWELLDNSFTHPATPVPCHIDAFSQNVSHFQNQEFCAVAGGLLGPVWAIIGYVAETDTYFEPNRVRGDEHATAFMTYQWRKDGLCNQLLQFNQKSQNVQIG